MTIQLFLPTTKGNIDLQKKEDPVIQVGNLITFLPLNHRIKGTIFCLLCFLFFSWLNSEINRDNHNS